MEKVGRLVYTRRNLVKPVINTNTADGRKSLGGWEVGLYKRRSFYVAFELLVCVDIHRHDGITITIIDSGRNIDRQVESLKDLMDLTVTRIKIIYNWSCKIFCRFGFG